MLNACIDGLLINLQLMPLTYMLIGCAIGFWVGILPGLGGGAAMALMMPFIYTMTPREALPFLLGMHSVTATTGDITSVLFGIPGEATTVATIVDGYPMAKKGEAGRALGAVLTSSLVGAIFGAMVLALIIPVVRPVVFAFGSPEIFMLTILGLTCISSLSSHGKKGLLQGLMIGGFGFICSIVGQDGQVGTLRFTFGTFYLWGGLEIVPVAVGFFAIPEIINLAIQKTAIAGNVPFGKLGAGAIEGIKDTFRHFWLVMRCSFIGSFIGLLPGVGGGIPQWIAYAHATQSAKNEKEKDSFGKGDIRGVLGPGASNNSREGAALIPVVAFGIPSGPGMAILLGALMVMGIMPGPDMLTKHLALTYSMVWTIVIANIVCVAVSLLFINHIAKLTTIRGELMVPFLLFLCFVGAFTSNHYGDLVVLIIFGGIGYILMRCGWPRPPFILGFVLGRVTEINLFTTITRYEKFIWLYRPQVIAILLIIALFIIAPGFLEKWRLRDEENGN